jgi:hypothetical protein
MHIVLTVLRRGKQKNSGSISTRGKLLFSPQNVQTSSGAPRPPISKGTEGSFSRGKASGAWNWLFASYLLHLEAFTATKFNQILSGWQLRQVSNQQMVQRPTPFPSYQNPDNWGGVGLWSVGWFEQMNVAINPRGFCRVVFPEVSYVLF